MSILRALLRSILCLVFVGAAAPLWLPHPVEAGDLKWSPVAIPAEGPAGKWALAAGSDIACLTQAPDGSLYCAANPTSTTYRLFKSTDRGLSWAVAGKVEDAIVDIAVSPGDPSTLCYATLSAVFICHDASRTFNLLARSPGGAGAGGIEITSIALTLVDGRALIVAGTRDTDLAQFGGIYTWTENLSMVWTDTGLTGCDVYEVAFSPDYSNDSRITCVATNETDTLVTTCSRGEGWGSSIGNARLSGVTPVSAQIAYPGDYRASSGSGRNYQYLGLNTGSGSGDVYRLTPRAAPSSSQLTDLNAGAPDGLAGLDIRGLAVFGSPGLILAGAAGSTTVYFSSDGGNTWIASLKPPTGTGNTQVLFDKAFAESALLYVATTGPESAFSVSRDWGQTWDQISLIDTRLTDIRDLALSRDFAKDGRLFLLTSDVKNSLWRSSDGGVHWERIFSSSLPGVDNLSLVKSGLSHELYLAGVGTGRACLWFSKDDGRNFRRVTTFIPDSNSQLAIDAWEMTPDGLMIAAGFDGSHGILCSLNKTALRFENTLEVGSQQINSLAFSPDFLQDAGILAGGKAGGVYYSSKDQDFNFLPSSNTASPLSGAVAVAFDPNFKNNRTVYAADDTLDAGIFRFVVGKSSIWEAIDNTLPSGSKIDRISLSANGILYGSNQLAVNAVAGKGGVERSVNPDYASGAAFQTVTKGLADGAILKKLWLSGQTLWSIDSVNSRLMTYTDLLPSSIKLVSPLDKANGLAINHLKLNWQSLGEGSTYRWQIDLDTDFTSLPAGFEGTTDSTSVILPALETDTTYFWRVRVETPVVSPWSANQQFSTILTQQSAGPVLSLPLADKSVSVQPLFQWSSFAGAESYELKVARDPAFTELVVDKSGKTACLTNAWKCDIKLDYDTAYYWKVRAISAANLSAWSPVGIFMTDALPNSVVPLSVTGVPAPTPTVAVASSGPITQMVVPAITITAVPAATDSLQSTLNWLFFAVGVLLVLNVGLSLAVIYLFRRLRKL